MKGKFAFVLCAFLCALSVPAFADDDYLYFGADYTCTTAGGYTSHALGGHLSVINDWLYVAVGFSADVSGDRNFGIDELRELGVGNIDMNFFFAPIRIGYPFMLGSEGATFLIAPALAFDLQFFSAKFSQRIDVYDKTVKMNYKMAGFGFTLGASLNLGMQHKIGKAYLRYGVDLDFGLFTEMTYRIDFSGFVSGSDSDAYITTVADFLQFSASPYICLGFRL